MRKILSFLFLFGVCSVNSNHLRSLQEDSCTDGVPIILPEVRLLNISRFLIGQPGQVHLQLVSSHPVEFLWYKNILKDQQSYPAIIKDDNHFSITMSHPSQDIYVTILKVKRVTPDDIKYNRFTLELTIRHPCATIEMKMMLGSDNILQRNLDNPVKIQAISKQMIKKNIGDTLRLRLKARYTARPNERLYGPPISVSKWYSMASRSGLSDRLKLYSNENDRELPPNAQNVINDVVKINHTTYDAESNMTLTPLFQSDQGFFQCRLTYDLVRDVLIHLYARTEFRYSDRLSPAVAIRPCSGLPNKGKETEIRNGAVQIPVRAGTENCIECLAHAVPDFMIVFAKTNPDFRTGIQFLNPIAKFDYGSLKRYIYPLAAVDGEVRHYVCTAGRKDAVTPAPMEVIPYDLVRLTEVTPNEMNLASTNKVKFICRATGAPSPTITFYRTPKNSLLPENAKPEDRGWVKMETGSSSVVMTTYDPDSKVTSGTMFVEDVGTNTGRGRFDYTCVAQNNYSRKTGTVFVDAFAPQFAPVGIPDGDNGY